jgi:MscS family membrane protein
MYHIRWGYRIKLVVSNRPTSETVENTRICYNLVGTSTDGKGFSMLHDFLDNYLSNDAADLVTRLFFVLAILLLTWLIRQIVGAIIPGVIRRLTRRTSTAVDNRIIDAIQPPIQFLVSVSGLWIAMLALGLPDAIQHALSIVLSTLAAYGIFWAIYRLVEPAVQIFMAISRRTMRDTSIPTVLDEKLTQIAQQIIKAIVIILGFAAVIQAWGYNVTGLVAGLGIGGLAVALAAQNTLENVLGYFVILADEPLNVGEYVVFGDISGAVETIGFRSTRIRVLDQSLVTVPNKTIMNANITNWSRLVKRRLNMTLGITYSSSPDQILSVVQAIREMLQNHDLVQADSVVVQFVNFNESSLDIMIICFMNTPDWGNFQAARQDINLRIIDILDERGVEVAFPSRTLYVEQAIPADAKPARPLPPPAPEPTSGTATDSPMPADAAN